jgi:DNA (cytosine-5)-methyltransferase 1
VTPLVIDNFAGGGGASTGIEAALGRAVDVAINHDPEAVAMHLANHPASRHFCQSIMAVDPLEATGGAPVALAWFSPDCKHHSKAKGGKPVEKNIRDLAWIVVHWAERLRKATPDGRGAPAIIMLENVEEFRQWGPLVQDAEGKHRPCPDRRGETFDLWVRALKRQGYRVQWRELRACDFGAPTSRKRLFLIARRDGLPIVWPTPTHGKRDSAEVERGERLPWRTAAEIIDWSLPCPSIFSRTRELKDTTKRRIAHGVMRYVVNAARPFVVGVGGRRGQSPERSIDVPWPTQTAKADAAIVNAAIVPITHAGGERTHSPDEPLRTVTTASRGELAATSATLIMMGYGERPGQEPRVPGLDQPARTVVSGGGKHGLVTAHLEKFKTRSAGASAAEPAPTVLASGGPAAVVTSFLSHFYTSNTNGGQGDPLQPVKTVTSEGQHHAVVCAHMEQANTGMVGHPATRPLSTIVGRGTTQRLVETTMVPADALPPELMERATRTAAFLIKYYGTGAVGQALDAPIHTLSSKDTFAVVTVTIEAATYVLVDIGMRMLTPRELARAQGFPDSYILDAPGPNGEPLTKTAQIRMIGNSVCPQMAEALVRANVAIAAEQVAA